MNVSSVTDWTAGLITGITAGMARLFGAIPNILGAIVVLVIGWIIAGIVASLVAKLARAIHVDTVADRAGVNGFLAQAGSPMRASGILGEIVKWVIRLVFVEMAAEQLGMPQVTQIINQILSFIPNIVVAIVILVVGAFLGQLLAGIVRGATSEARLGNADLLAKLTQGIVMAFAIIAALNELNVAPVVVDTLYIGLVGALALALGLAFGLGGRDVAARLTERWINQAESTTRKLQTTSTTSTTPSLEPDAVPTVKGTEAPYRAVRAPGLP
jgi:Conserved TM helix